METNCHTNSCRAGQAGIPWPLPLGLRQTASPKGGLLQANNRNSSTIFHHSCLCIEFFASPTECQGCTACTAGPFSTHLFPPLFQSLLSSSWKWQKCSRSLGPCQHKTKCKGLREDSLHVESEPRWNQLPADTPHLKFLTHVLERENRRKEWNGQRGKEQFNRGIFLFFFPRVWALDVQQVCWRTLLTLVSPSPESTHHINIILLQASLLQWINQVSQK